MKLVWLAVLVLAALGHGRVRDFDQYRAVQESLSRVPPRLRGEWLDRRGLTLPPWNAPLPTTSQDDSLGLRLVGKWGRGPACEVTGQGSLVALTLGSEVALLDFANPDSPVVLSEIQLDLIPRQSALYGSYLVTSDDGIEFWDITDPRTPVFRSSIPYTVGDFAIADTFLFFIRGDTFHAYNIANPLNPYQLGTCVEGGYVTAATRNVAVVRAPGDVMDFIDVSNPATPFRAGTYPSFALGAAARGNICCANIYWSTDYDHFRFEVLDISDPANVHRIGAIDSVGGWDVHLSGPLAFVSGDQNPKWEFTIVSLQDSTNPQVISACATPSNNYAVWADWMSDYSYVADMTGLAVVDISNLNAPVLDTVILKAGEAYDVAVNGAMAYVADYRGGLRVLDVSDPARPAELGGHDTLEAAPVAVVARDSFAYANWWPSPYFRSFDVSDPTNPRQAGGAPVPSEPAAMVLRDTFVYAAAYRRFEVVNVARPREPVVVGTCNMSGYSDDVCLADTLAHVTSQYFTTVNIVRPDSPRIVHEWSARASGIFVADTILYMAYYGLKTASIANPLAPYVIDSVYVDDFTETVVVVDSLAYLGGNTVRIYNVADPANIIEVGSWTPPAWVYRLRFVSPYLYAACYDAGVCILDTAMVGIGDTGQGSRITATATVWPTVVRDRLLVAASDPAARVTLYSATGADVTAEAGSTDSNGPCRGMDMGKLPAGVYIVRVSNQGGMTFTAKVIKANGR